MNIGVPSHGALDNCAIAPQTFAHPLPSDSPSDGTPNATLRGSLRNQKGKKERLGLRFLLYLIYTFFGFTDVLTKLPRSLYTPGPVHLGAIILAGFFLFSDRRAWAERG